MRLVKENNNILVLDDKNTVIMIKDMNDIPSITEEKHHRLVSNIRKLSSNVLLEKYTEFVGYVYSLGEDEELEPEIEEMGDALTEELARRLNIS